MSFDNSFDEDETNYTDIFVENDTNAEYARKTYGILGGKFYLKVIVPRGKHEALPNEAPYILWHDLWEPFFKKVQVIRNTAEQNNPIFKNISDESIQNLKPGERHFLNLEFKNLEPIKVRITPDPKVKYAYLQPLGCYYPGQDVIALDYDKICACAKEQGISDDNFLLIVFCHEMMHYMMDERTPKKQIDEHLYWTFFEEAYANYFMLKLLESTGNQNIATEARRFIETQPHDLGYSYALILEEDGKQQGWEDWKDLKTKRDLPESEMKNLIECARKKLRKKHYKLKCDEE